MEEQVPNKRVYLIGGIGCSGKSTFAKKLADNLKIPYFRADNVYTIVASNLNIKPDKLVHAPMESTWVNPEPLEINDFGIYGSMRECVKSAYLEFFSYNIPQSFVIEGEAIFWNPHERDLLKEMLSDYEKINICIQPTYEKWLRNRTNRIKEGGHIPVFRDESEYDELYKNYEQYFPKNTLFIGDTADQDCSLTGGTNYQCEDFSDPKWKIYDFPKDMAGKKFLDISCNTGWFSKKAHDAGAKVFGLDISWQVLLEAMARVPSGTFTLSKVEDFKFEKYDYVLSSSAFHYYHHREDVIKRISESTNYFILETPILISDKEDILYDDSYVDSFCTLISEPLLLKWLKKYFKNVEKIGETVQPNGRNRPVYKCTK